MTYPCLTPANSPQTTAVPRRSKSEGYLDLDRRQVQNRSASNQKLARPRHYSLSGPPLTTIKDSKPRRRSEALLQWDALADREGQPSYQIPFYTTLSKRNRSKIAEWCYKVVDYFEIDRRVVSIALSHFDRYLASEHSVCNGENSREVWLVVMACLQLAIKLHSNKQVHTRMLANVRATCRYSEQEVSEEELHICSALQWYLNPSVPVMYLEVANPLINEIVHSEKISKQMMQRIGELSKFLIELSAHNLELSAERPSSVAHAAILVAMNHLHTSTSAMNRWLGLTLKHSSHLTDRCIPKLQSILLANEMMVRCSSPTNVERNM